MADRRRAFESVSKKRYEPERREVPGKRPTLASGGFHLARWVGALSRNANGNAARLTCQDGGAAISSGVQYPYVLQSPVNVARLPAAPSNTVARLRPRCAYHGRESGRRRELTRTGHCVRA